MWDIAGEKHRVPRRRRHDRQPGDHVAHNAVISPDGRYLVINDEAFGFPTCEGEAADLYGSLWIYVIPGLR